ncbi:MAG TPA: PAS domain S-box protein [Candidatus Dormibacteraeota bacterium]|nr:PAS domain S-box protein [Candidatus Dormibacteraeota bacterium]
MSATTAPTTSPTSRPRAGTAEALGLDVLATMVRASADGIIVLDGDDRVVYANPAACRLHGYPPDRLLGHDFLTFVPEQDRQTALTLFANAHDGRSAAMASVTYRPDGSQLHVEATATVLDLRSKRFIVVVSRDVTERHRQARQAAALAQAAASVAVSDSVEATLDAIAECALSGTRALAAWVVLDREYHDAAWAGTAGMPDEFREYLRRRPPASARAARSSIIEVLAAERVVVSADWRQRMERDDRSTSLAGALSSLPWQAAAFAPLVYRGAHVGVLSTIYRKGELPCDAETAFLAALADQATMAAEQARLVAAARETVLLEERKRIARELHDSISQSLYGIQLGAKTARDRLERDPASVAQPIDHVMRLAEAGEAEMRALILGLRAESLETEGLVACLVRQIAALRARHGFAGQTALGDEPEAPIEVKHALYRIVGEALSNTVKHAHAQRVDVRLEARRRAVLLEIADDGVGFDTGGLFPGHLGLRSMHERALAVGGLLEVTSSRGKGTRVRVKVPLAPPNPPRGERSQAP